MAEKEIKAKRSNRQKTLDMVYIAIFAVIIAVFSASAFSAYDFTYEMSGKDKASHI